MKGFMLIHLDHLLIRDSREIHDEYFSFLWNDQFYFSTVFSHQQIENFSIPISHSILLPYQETLLENILLQVWQNHMILFEHSIDISELNTRKATRKKIEVRQGEILEYSIHLLEEKEIIARSKQDQSLLQHYLVIQSMKTQQNITDSGPSYFKIEFSEGEVIVPVFNAIAMVPLPNKLRFWHIKNGKPYSKSKLYTSEEIEQSHLHVQLVKGESQYELQVTVKWLTNLFHEKNEINALLGAHDVILSEIELRLANGQGMKSDVRPQMYSGSKLKVVVGNKAYQLNGDLDLQKLNRFARIIYFIVKSEEEDFSFSLEKNLRVVGKATVGTDQLLSYHPNVIKKKLIDPHSGKIVATVKFKGEKAKNLSLPQNNKFWKQYAQNKVQAIMLEISQLSFWGAGQPCGLIIKSEQQQIILHDVPDFSIFKLETELPEPIILTIKQEGSIYFKLIENQSDGKDFLGMAVMNPKDLRLGAVPIVLPFYKQKQLICEAEMIVNKVMPWPFVKGLPQLEAMTATGMKSISLSVTLKSVELTSYYWSYLYEGKGDFYCILELNRVKKVVILERVTSTQRLLFLSTTGSDLLNFVVDQQQSFKIRLTLLASDQGVQQQIYGTTQKRIKYQDLEDGPFIVRQQQFANSSNLNVGQVDFQVQKGLLGQFKRVPVKHELNLVKQDLDKINKSIEKVEKKISSPQQQKKHFKSKKKYQSLVLPEIKDPKQERLKRLAKFLQVRQQHKRRYQKMPQTSRDIEKEEIPVAKNRVKSQGGSGIYQLQREEVDEPLPPIPNAVQQQIEYQPERNSDLKMDIPPNEFEENEFAEPGFDQYQGQFQGDPLQ